MTTLPAGQWGLRRLPAIFRPNIIGFMNEVTRFLNAAEHGDPNAAAQLLPLVCDELRRLAAAKMTR
jgi:ECF sigma factor